MHLKQRLPDVRVPPPSIPHRLVGGKLYAPVNIQKQWTPLIPNKGLHTLRGCIAAITERPRTIQIPPQRPERTCPRSRRVNHRDILARARTFRASACLSWPLSVTQHRRGPVYVDAGMGTSNTCTTAGGWWLAMDRGPSRHVRDGPCHAGAGLVTLLSSSWMSESPLVVGSLVRVSPSRGAAVVWLSLCCAAAAQPYERIPPVGIVYKGREGELQPSIQIRLTSSALSHRLILALLHTHLSPYTRSTTRSMPRFAFATVALILSLALSTLAGPVPRNVEATPIPSSVVAAIDAAAPVSEAFHFGPHETSIPPPPVSGKVHPGPLEMDWLS
ncbi:hypothetical protein C8Q77DRAFT_140864 [Trametes polyzona]|nr:hypothetical protein C8Q77DRAFT_140864 [Trametes polyzona]